MCAQSDLNIISDEIEAKDLRLNTKKTKLLVISRRQKPPALTLSIKEEVVEQVPSFKYLGITISQNLSWSLHIGNMCCKARRLLGYLYRCFRLHVYPVLGAPCAELLQQCLGSPRVPPHQQAGKSPRVRCQTCDWQME